MMKLGVVLVVMVSAGAAFADAQHDQQAARAAAIQEAKAAGIVGTKLTGDKAMNLVRAIKFAGVKPTTANSARTFKVAALHCWSTKAGTDEQLGDYKCSLDKLAIKDGLAFLLQSAMDGAGIASDDHMSQHTTDAKFITCDINPAKAGDERFVCIYSEK